MDYPILMLSKRDQGGKGVNRRLRTTGLIPGVIYGQEVEKPIMVSLDPRSLRKSLEGKFGRNTVISIKFEQDDKTQILAMLQDYQFHPATRRILHVDFISISPDREIEAKVPLLTTGKAVGIAKGGLLMEIYREVPVMCLPKDIPTEFVVDVTLLDIGHSLKVADMTFPPGVRTTLPPEQALISVTTIKEEVEAAPVVAAEAEGEGKEGEEKKGEEKEGEEKGEKKGEEKKGEEKDEKKDKKDKKDEGAADKKKKK